MKSKYLTKRQKLYRIARTHTKLSNKSINKLMRLRKSETFNKRLKQVVGGVKGAARKASYKTSIGQRALIRREKLVVAKLKQDPKNKSLQRQYVAITRQRNRKLEREATPQEREEMIFRHQKREAEMLSAIAHDEALPASTSPLLPKELIEMELSSEFKQWRETADADRFLELEKEIRDENDMTDAEAQEAAEREFEPLTDEEAMEKYLKEEVLHLKNVEISERNGMYLLKVGDDYVVFYQNQQF